MLSSCEGFFRELICVMRGTCWQSAVQGYRQSADGVLKVLCRQSLGGPAIGVAFALCALLCGMLLPPDACLHSSLLLAGAYGCFVVAEDMLHSSGILAVVAMGMATSLLGGVSQTAKPKPSKDIELIWCAG